VRLFSHYSLQKVHTGNNRADRLAAKAAENAQIRGSDTMRSFGRGVVIAFAALALMGTSASDKAGADPYKTQTAEAVGDKTAAGDHISPEQQVTPRFDQGCERGKDDRQSDLCAQWKAADAAADGVSLAYWQTVIGWIGIALGAATMAAAIAAAWYARSAAIHSRTAATAFVEAERATIRFAAEGEAGTAPNARHLVQLTIDARNIGRSNARLRSIQWQAAEDASWPVAFEHQADVNRTVEPGGAEELDLIRYLTPNDQCHFVTGRLDYETIMGKRFRTHFCFRVAKRQRPPNVVGVRDTVVELKRYAGQPDDD
jgi:hypothetical protein